MADSTIDAQTRTEFGKGAARRIRRAHMIPVVLYGHGIDPIHLSLPGHQTARAVKGANAVLTLMVEGQERLALVKDIQRDPVRPVIEHMDLVLVRRGEKVTVDVQIQLVGDAAPDTLVTVENQTIEVTAEATAIPESIEISIAGATAGSQIHAGDMSLPAGVELLSDPELLVVNVTAAMSAQELEAELSAAPAGPTPTTVGAEQSAAPSDAS
jgi:large subunit ribosomal protein L25